MTGGPRADAPAGEDEADTPYDRERPLTDHLEEFRRRALWSLAALAAAAAAAYFFVDPVIGSLSRVVGPMVFVRPLEAFAARLKLSVLLGAFLGAPLVLYHAWRFVGVALTVSERRVVAGALPFAYLLFAAGALFGWFVIVPVGLKFLVSFSTADVRPLLSVEACLEFAVWACLGLGLLFQIPVAVGALAKWGLLRSAVLARFRRHALLGILVLAAVLTPGPDVVSQLLLAGPAYLLFELSLLVARFLEPEPSAPSS